MCSLYRGFVFSSFFFSFFLLSLGWRTSLYRGLCYMEVRYIEVPLYTCPPYPHPAYTISNTCTLSLRWVSILVRLLVGGGVGVRINQTQPFLRRYVFTIVGLVPMLRRLKTHYSRILYPTFRFLKRIIIISCCCKVKCKKDRNPSAEE